MASQSTRSRWMNCTGLTIGGHAARDNMGIQFGSSSDTVGSNSENDKYANHFLQGVQKSDNASIRIFDLCAATYYASLRGDITTFSCFIPKASAGSATTGFTLSSWTTNGGGALIQEVSIDASKDKEGEAQISLIFRSPGGIASGMNLTALRAAS